MSASDRLSVRLQDIAAGLSDVLQDISGEPLAFVLVVSADNTAQYVSNAKRHEGKELIESLLHRWNAERADIPAHYNPDLKAVQQHLYKELLHAVASAFPNETCHETALRYIRNAEAGNNNAEAAHGIKEKP